MVEIRVTDSEDAIQNELTEKRQQLEERLNSSQGLLGGFKRARLNKQIKKLDEEFDARSLELGSQKPSGYHG